MDSEPQHHSSGGEAWAAQVREVWARGSGSRTEPVSGRGARSARRPWHPGPAAQSKQGRGGSRLPGGALEPRFGPEVTNERRGQSGRGPLLPATLRSLSRKLTQRRRRSWDCLAAGHHFRRLRWASGSVVMPLARDLVHPSLEDEKKKHKKKRLVQSPNSYFMDVKCPGCYKITTVFSHAQTVVLCVGCSTVLCQPTGGKARLTEGCSFRRKQH
ncbi:40S ribosomal protein S27-like [Dromiciops gliroides]|uniref:40S ribosomal protein S27-like n=1 Tax=Dromiciops gliroides TaxID=33562 RepID=UPI001CC65B6C|nr:40S ribosomal protein S27-like [Dromiciops gliroides]